MNAGRRAAFVLIASALAGVSAGVSAQLSRDPDYALGKQAWERRDWPTATSHLAKFMAPGEDRASYEVAFWLGTSWCRMPGKEVVGADALGWGQRFKLMPEQARPKFEIELKRCLQWLANSAANRPLPEILLTVAGSGTATYRSTGKTYVVGGDSGSLAAYPVRMKRPMKMEVLEARLVRRDETERAMEQALKLVPGATVYASKYTVLVSLSKHGTKALERIGETVDAFVQFLGTEYGLTPPEWYITVYMFPNISMLRKWADTLHGLDASPATLGYAFENDQSVLAMLNGEGAGTLLHEVFHLVVRSSYASVPQWLDEGIASLYETSTRRGERFFGEPNWRSPVFREMRPAVGNRVTLEQVITSPWLSDEPNHAPPDAPDLGIEEQTYLLAYSRLFALYLQNQRQLSTVLDAYRKRVAPGTYVPAQTQAITLVEQTLGKSLPQVERDFLNWVPSVYDPNRRLYLGGIPVRKELPGAKVQSIPKELPNIKVESLKRDGSK
jgi:hypothetical protein